MNKRIDIIGPAGVGKTTFAKRMIAIIEDRNIIGFDNAIVKAISHDRTISAYKKLYIKARMPFRQQLVNYIIRKKIKGLAFDDKYQWQHLIEELIAMRPIEVRLWMQRIKWLMERIEVMDYIDGKISGYIVLYDESILHKIVSYIINTYNDEKMINIVLDYVPVPYMIIYCKSEEDLLLLRNIKRNVQTKDRFGKFRMGKDKMGRDIIKRGISLSQEVKKYYEKKGIKVIEVDTGKNYMKDIEAIKRQLEEATF